MGHKNCRIWNLCLSYSLFYGLKTTKSLSSLFSIGSTLNTLPSSSKSHDHHEAPYVGSHCLKGIHVELTWGGIAVTRNPSHFNLALITVYYLRILTSCPHFLVLMFQFFSVCLFPSKNFPESCLSLHFRYFCLPTLSCELLLLLLTVLPYDTESLLKLPHGGWPSLPVRGSSFLLILSYSWEQIPLTLWPPERAPDSLTFISLLRRALTYLYSNGIFSPSNYSF